MTPAFLEGVAAALGRPWVDDGGALVTAVPSCTVCQRDVDEVEERQPTAPWYEYAGQLLCHACADDFGGMASLVVDVDRWGQPDELDELDELDEPAADVRTSAAAPRAARRRARPDVRTPGRPRQLDLFEPTVVLDVDGRPVDVGAPVTLHPEGTPAVLVSIDGRYRNGGWRVVVQPDGDAPPNVRGSYQLRAV